MTISARSSQRRHISLYVIANQEIKNDKEDHKA